MNTFCVQYYKGDDKMLEKIKVNLSYNVYHLLLKDIESFQFYKNNNEGNMNLFINTIVFQMMAKKRKRDDEIYQELKQLDLNNQDQLLKITTIIQSLINNQYEDHSNRFKGYYISFRPSKKFEDLYNYIEENELNNLSLSQFFRNLLNEYAALPQDEREHIIFYDTYLKIQSAIHNKNYICFKDRNIKDFIPYKIVKTSDELYNYVIGAFKRNNHFHYFSLHLFKCSNIVKMNQHFELTEVEISQFESILINGPREIERRNGESIVRLTLNGIKLFKKFYLNRPIPTKIEDNLYYFNSSYDNLFYYFSRFGKDAIILSPLHLKNRMISFYLKSLNSYQNN